MWLVWFLLAISFRPSTTVTVLLKNVPNPLFSKGTLWTFPTTTSTTTTTRKPTTHRTVLAIKQSSVPTHVPQTKTIKEERDGTAPWIPLNDNSTIPALGLGTFLGFDENGKLDDAKADAVLDQVAWALKSGYRLIDTASTFQTESQIGDAIEESSIPRGNLYIVTKLGSHEQRHVVESLRASLRRLRLSYVDLYLIHTPVAFKDDFIGFDVVDYVDTWKAMEEAKRLKLTKSIGLANFNISQISRILANCSIKPAVLQVEVTLHLAQTSLLNYCKSEGIVVMGYTPLGTLFDFEGHHPPPRYNNTKLVELATKYNKTTPQIVLRYLTQRGVIPIPRTMDRELIKQYINIFNFTLTSEEIGLLTLFNVNYRAVLPVLWQAHPYCPFQIHEPETNTTSTSDLSIRDLLVSVSDN